MELTRWYVGEVGKMWKYPWWQVHRVDFHRELKRVLFSRCEDDGKKAHTPTLILGTVVKHINTNTGLVTLTDGRTFSSNVIIGADGNASFARSQIDPNAKLERWGKVCFRFLVPRQTLLDDPETRDLVAEESWFSEVAEADKRFVIYGCRRNTTVNVAAFVPNGEANVGGHGKRARPWSRPSFMLRFCRYRLEPAGRQTGHA